MANGADLNLVCLAIRSGTFGHIEFKDSVYRQLRDDPEMAPFTPTGIRQLIRDFVSQNPQDVTAHAETRAEWLEEDPDSLWWYRVIVPVPEFEPQGLFVELKLVDDDPVEPWVRIVSVHRQRR